MTTLIRTRIQKGIQKATPASIFVKEFRYSPQDKHVSVFFFESNDAFRRIKPLKDGIKGQTVKEFDLWFYIAPYVVNQKEVVKTTLRIALQVMYYDFVDSISFHYSFKDANEKYHCDIDKDFCAALLNRAEREEKYNADFFTKTAYQND